MRLNINYIVTPATVEGKYDMKPETPPFKDLQHSGQLIAKKLIKEFGELLDGSVIVGCARGGLYGAEAVVREIRETTKHQVQLDTVITRRVNLPSYIFNMSDVGIGAIAEDGSSFVREDLKERLGRLYSIDFNTPQIEQDINKVFEQEKIELQRRINAYRIKDGADRKRADLNRRVVIVYDDGMATGTTAMAAIKSIQNQTAPNRIIFAVPMCADRSMANVLLKTGLTWDDTCVLECFEQKEGYRFNTDHFYEQVADVPDETVCAILDNEEKYFENLLQTQKNTEK